MSKELVKILNLRCCQMALWMFEVKAKIKHFEQLSKSEFLKESQSDPVLVVVGPDKNLYIVEGHHRTLAAWMAGFKKIFVQIKMDFSKKELSLAGFRREMKRKNCTELFDQFGQGPPEPLYLPLDVRGLGDDPYRSLAWLAKEEGAFKESKQHFATFKWANFYREYKLLPGRCKRDFKKAKKNALIISHQKAARDLPGFIASHPASHG